MSKSGQSDALKKAFGTSDLRAIVGKPFAFTYTRFDGETMTYLSIIADIGITETLSGEIGMVTCSPFPSINRERFGGFSIELREEKPVWRMGVLPDGTEGTLRLL